MRSRVLARALPLPSYACNRAVPGRRGPIRPQPRDPMRLSLNPGALTASQAQSRDPGQGKSAPCLWTAPVADGCCASPASLLLLRRYWRPPSRSGRSSGRVPRPLPGGASSPVRPRPGPCRRWPEDRGVAGEIQPIDVGGARHLAPVGGSAIPHKPCAAPDRSDCAGSGRARRGRRHRCRRRPRRHRWPHGSARGPRPVPRCPASAHSGGSARKPALDEDARLEQVTDAGFIAERMLDELADCVEGLER